MEELEEAATELQEQLEVLRVEGVDIDREKWDDTDLPTPEEIQAQRIRKSIDETVAAVTSACQQQQDELIKNQGRVESLKQNLTQSQEQ